MDGSGDCQKYSQFRWYNVRFCDSLPTVASSRYGSHSPSWQLFVDVNRGVARLTKMVIAKTVGVENCVQFIALVFVLSIIIRFDKYMV